jgi:hypothetical protein
MYSGITVLEIAFAVALGILIGGFLLMAIHEAIRRDKRNLELDEQFALLEEGERVAEIADEIITDVMAEHINEYHKEK